MFILAFELAVFAGCAFTHGLCPWWFEYELVDWTMEYILIFRDCLLRLGQAPSDSKWEDRLPLKYDETKPAAVLTYFHYQTRDSFDNVYKRDARLVNKIREDFGFFRYHLVEANFLKATHDSFVIHSSNPDDTHTRSVNTDAQLAAYERMRDAGKLANACTLHFWYTHLLVTVGGVKRLVRTSKKLFGLALFSQQGAADELVDMIADHTAFLGMVWVAFPGLQSWTRVKFSNEVGAKLR